MFTFDAYGCSFSCEYATNHRLLPIAPHPELVFIFDELDKIDPANDDTHQRDNEGTNEFLASSPGDSVRLRKFEVEQLLSNLKNIITVAPSRFIFIAGRDMMDANLADQSEVNHLYSSLFDETLYIPSFLTDHSDEEEEDISSMVEQYVCRRLLPRPIAYYLYWEEFKKDKVNVPNDELEIEYNCWNLKVYLLYLKELSDGADEDWEELASFLLDFIYYLTYRSAGSPKKLSLQFEEFVAPVPDNLLIRGEKEYSKHPPVTNETRFLLKFDEREQYQIQMISHIFILLHGETSHMIRQYGDKLSLSTFSILDYLFKYHSIAFSARDLERMPDVLDIHRAPALPQVIDVLLEKMLTPYLQHLDNGVYEYRFLQHFQREIVYISQFSERDLAAFNFTLDESISIKQHYRDLLKRQMQFQKGFHEGIQGGSKESETWHTLPSLHIILGDISTLDREFSEALTEYRNALQYLEPALEAFDIPHDQIDEESVIREKQVLLFDHSSKSKYWQVPSSQPMYKLSTSMNQLLLYIQILLKMGLLAERRNQYDNASAHYFHAYRIVDHVLKSRLGRRFIIPNFSLLPVLYQPYICLAYIHVKRDLLPESADKIIKRAHNKFEKYLRDSGKENDGFNASIEPDRNQQIIFMAKLKMNWAEILVQQSRFEAARDKYLEVINALILVILPSQDCDLITKRKVDLKVFRILQKIIVGKTKIKSVFSILGLALSGLGDVCSGLCLKDYYENKKFSMIIPNEEERRSFLKDEHCNDSKKFLNWNFRSIGEIKTLGIYIYLLSAEIHKQNDSTAEAALSLWKIQNVLSYGLSYKPLLGEGLLDDEFYNKSDWLFDKRLVKLTDSAFKASYATHHERLEEIGLISGGSKNIKKWIAPPLNQTSMVLKEFRNKSSKMDFELRHMGAFPIHTRILAGYLKALFFYEKNHSPPEYIRVSKMFYLLVQSAEDGSAFEGGMESLSPHLGAIYYLLWKFLKDFRMGNEYQFDKIIEANKEFTGEKRRFLSDKYCNTRAYKLLSEITGRHNKDSAFTSYINRQYYLHGVFSDSYAQGIWSIDYAICPAVEKMKEELLKNA